LLSVSAAVDFIATKERAVPVEFSQIPLSDLSIGAVLTTPIFDVDAKRTKLLGQGVEINQPLLDQLNSRGVTRVSISKRDLAAMSAGVPQGTRKTAADHTYAPVKKSTEESKVIDSEINSPEFHTEIEDKVVRSLDTLTDCYDREAIAHEVQQREAQISYVDGLYDSLIKGDGSEVEGLTEVCRQSIESMLRDKDLFSCLGVTPYDGDYPSRHSLHTCSVAISIGFVLGLDDKSLLDLGTGCLIHDVGMLKLDSQIYRTNRKLNEKELALLAEHPLLTMDALSSSDARISPIARIVAYQIHERCNGGGYPRGTKGDQLHILSRIAAVADAYVALLSNRWHRPGMMPYYAMEKMLKSIPEGLFDPKAIRGLLHVVSLFPLGSFIETHDGRIARVVRSTGATYMQPIVEIWNKKHNMFEPELVNLVDETNVKIKRAIATP
jgi:HD-GYP domain-containing protein (c-di-GMP phosphodiesterase class II)